MNPGKKKEEAPNRVAIDSRGRWSIAGVTLYPGDVVEVLFGARKVRGRMGWNGSEYALKTPEGIYRSSSVEGLRARRVSR